MSLNACLRYNDTILTYLHIREKKIENILVSITISTNQQSVKVENEP
jgi:hypothetical protein